MFFRSLFFLLSFFFWPVHCLFFDLRILITPLVSLNSSFGYPVWALCSQNFKLFGFPIFRFWAYLVDLFRWSVARTELDITILLMWVTVWWRTKMKAFFSYQNNVGRLFVIWFGVLFFVRCMKMCVAFQAIYVDPKYYIFVLVFLKVYLYGFKPGFGLLL